MAIVLLFFWRVCLLRLGPELSPTHPWYVALVLAANLTCSIAATALMTGLPILGITTSVVVSTATLAGLVYLACILRKVDERFVATFATILGCDFVITAILTPTIQVAELLGPAPLNIARLAFLFWTVTVTGFVLSKTLNLHMAFGAGFAFTFLFISSGIAASVSA